MISLGGPGLLESIRSAGNRPVQVLLVAVATALMSLWFAADAQGQATQKVDEDASGADYVAGELLVTYESGLSSEAAETLPEKAGGRVSQSLTEVDTQVVTFPEIEGEASGETREQSLERKKKALEADPAVASVDYNYLRQAFFIPDDPRFDNQYGLAKIKAPAAWNTTQGNRKVRIAIVDTGIDNNHPDLGSKIVAQRSFVGATTSPSGQDNAGHGTAVAGVAAAVTDNGRGVAGTCPNCSLMAAKISNSTDAIAVADEIQGINWATNNGADVINLSLGGPGAIEAEERAVNRAWNNGIVVVAAAGNAGTQEPNYPAAYRRSISVVATDRRDRKAGFSSFGRTVDVSAPGVNITTTDIVGPGGFAGGDYSSVDGTSFSSPMVAGVAGLLDAQGRTAPGIRKRLQSTATDLGSDGRDNRYGHGRINAAAAVKRGRTNVPDKPKPDRPKPNSKDRPREEDLLDIFESDEFPFGVLPKGFPFDFVKR